MPRSRSVTGSVVVYDVGDLCEQQRILLDLHAAGLSGVVALGTQDGGRVGVVVECRTEGDRWLVQQVVAQLSPTARLLTSQPSRTEVRATVVPREL